MHKMPRVFGEGVCRLHYISLRLCLTDADLMLTSGRHDTSRCMFLSALETLGIGIPPGLAAGSFRN